MRPWPHPLHPGKHMTQQWMEPGREPGRQDDVVQAGFLRRWAALFLDQLILGVAYYALLIVLMMVFGIAGGLDLFSQVDAQDPPGWFVAAYLGVMLLYYAAAGLYFSLMESSRHQATLGKMALGIKVVNAHGGRLSFAHALGRWFAALLSYVTLYIGFLMAAFTGKKQALHDLVAGTFVVDRWAYTEFPERQQRTLGGCVIVFVIAMMLMIGIAVLGILAAIALPAYQEYTGRARFAQVLEPVNTLRSQVEDALQRDGSCPNNGSQGFLAAEAYAGPGINRIVVDEFDQGFCGISVWMPPLRGTVERQFMLELDVDSGRWYCSAPSGVENLPSWCH